MSASSWIDAVLSRHTTSLTTSELARAARALSARYVERRQTLPGRSAIDSAGKRAAFAALFAPIHFLTVGAVVRAIGAARRAPATLIDLGCGTGVASAAWALECRAHPSLQGIDRDSWATGEASWNWRQLGLSGRTRRVDLVAEAERLATTLPPQAGIVAGWAVNELALADRRRLLPALLALGRSGAAVLIVEPIAKTAVPWWDEWAAAFQAAGGRADEWRFEIELPSRLKSLDEAAGFRRDELAARSLWIGRASA